MQDVKEVNVRAFRDEEAGVWVAESEDVPGLVTEAETMESLLEKLCILVPELLELNGFGQRAASIHLHSDCTFLVRA